MGTVSLYARFNKFGKMLVYISSINLCIYTCMLKPYSNRVSFRIHFIYVYFLYSLKLLSRYTPLVMYPASILHMIVCILQLKYQTTAPVDWTSVSNCVYKHTWITCRKDKPSISMIHIDASQSYVQL